MEAGQQNNIKVGFIIQARMKSTRLPGKVLLPLPLSGGKPIIRWIVDAVKCSRFDHSVILATSTDTHNDPLQEYCITNDIQCFRGDEDDVLSRFTSIIENNAFDVVVRLTGDNPLVDISILDDIIDKHVARGNDYTYTSGLPLGMNFEVVNPAALIAIKDQPLSPADREHVTLFVRNSVSIKSENIKFSVDSSISQARLTIDHSIDFILVSTLISLMEPYSNSRLSLLENISSIARKFDWLFKVNQQIGQRKAYTNIEEERLEAVELLKLHNLNSIAAQLMLNE